jgi:hypothetical protein
MKSLLTGLRAFILTCALGSGVAGCGVHRIENITPAVQMNMMQDFANGRAVLDCDAACSWPWIRAEQELVTLYQSQQWERLAFRVMEIGSQRDIGYFYLGRAAEEMGYPEAALRYYRISGALSVGDQPNRKCATAGFSNRCYGVVLPPDLYPRIQGLRIALGIQPPPAASRSTRTPGFSNRQPPPRVQSRAPRSRDNTYQPAPQPEPEPTPAPAATQRAPAQPDRSFSVVPSAAAQTPTRMQAAPPPPTQATQKAEDDDDKPWILPPPVKR